MPKARTTDVHARRSLVVAAVLAGLVLAAPTSAPAGVKSCTVVATGVAFGNITGSIASTPAQSTGLITLFCNGNGNNQTITVALSRGQGTYALRKMTSKAGGVLNYNLYLDAARSKVWGDGSGGSQVASDAFDFRPDNTIVIDNPVFGQVSTQAAPPSGAYVDQILVTVSF